MTSRYYGPSFKSLDSGPGPDYIHFESVSGCYRCSPCPDFVNVEPRSRSGSGSGFYPLPVRILFWPRSGFYPFLNPGPGPDFVKSAGSMSVIVSGSISGFYPFRVRVRLLSSMSGSVYASGFYKCSGDSKKFQQQIWKISP